MTRSNDIPVINRDVLPATAGSSWRRQSGVCALLGLGVVVWVYNTYPAELTWGHWVAALVAAILSLVPAVQRRVIAALDAVRQPSPRAFRWASVGIFVGSLLYFYINARIVRSDFIPKIHDELSYMVQIQQVAHGHFWMPGHKLPQFFENFYIISTRDTYGSMYFPGLALLYAPTVWLHLPILTGPALVVAALIVLMYRLMTELIDGTAGALSVLLMICVNRFPMLALMVFSQTPLLLMGLLMFWAWLRWRRAFQLRYALAMGFFAGWAAITRPLDALVFALPIGLAMLLDLRVQPARRWIASFACVATLAAPFLTLQAVVNIRITGHVSQFPHDYYVARDFPQAAYGFFTLDRTLRPVSTLPQKIKFHDNWAIPAIQKHRPETLWNVWLTDRLPYTWKATLPQPLLVMLIPVGLLCLRDRRRWVLFATLPLFVLAYIPYTFFCVHYPVVVAPAGMMCFLMGKREVEDAFPRLRPWLRTLLTLVLVVLSLSTIPAFNPKVRGDSGTTALWRNLDKKIQALPGPAVVLFHFDPAIHNADKEPCYNTDVAWPDDARVVRAQDLGAMENRKLFNYYAEEFRAGRQPNRAFYFWDRPANEEDCTYDLKPLGYATDLADKP